MFPMLNVLSKTGLGGVSANKGGIAVSFKFSDTTICFVSAHLAAGLSNIEERHQNYKALIKGIQFSKNRRIQNHDAVIWLGDFNYRIDLTNDQVKPMILQKLYAKIFECDQLNKQMANGESFPFFQNKKLTSHQLINLIKVPKFTILVKSRESRHGQIVYYFFHDKIL